MQIQVLSVNIITVPTAKGSYQKADTAYKNLSFQGKVEGKVVMSFGITADSFKQLAVAQPGDVFDVEVVKNQAGFNDWVKMTKGVAGAGQATNVQPGVVQAPRSAAASSPVRSTYETPEERAVKQVYIVKQSSVSNAVATLSVGAKSVKPEDVIALAQKYTDFVFSRDANKVSTIGGASGFDDIPDLDNPALFEGQPNIV